MIRRIRGLLAALLAIVMALGLAPGAALAEEVEREPQSGGKAVACLGTSAIVAKGGQNQDQFSGSYVYYGKYDGSPTKYRVLANGTTDFGGTTMLLDCDAILATTAYGIKRAWTDSMLQAWTTIGDDGTFGAEDEKKGAFTAPEKAAIAESFTSREGELEPDDATTLGADFKLTGEQAFVLSAGEASGYYADNDARKKNGGDDGWWLRTAGTIEDSACAAFVSVGGDVRSIGYSADSDSIGVCPAFNINLKSVIFSSLIPDTTKEYKLTITDATLAASGTATLDGTTATVTYTTTGENASQASYLVTDQAWSDSDGWPAEAKVLAYGVLGEAGQNKSGTFELPGDCAADDWGADYHVYVLAETVREGNATDYASAPAEAKIAPATFKVSVAEGIEHGTVTTDKAEAAEGDPVKISAKADDGYELDTVTVTDVDGKQVETKDGSFAMPASDVTVSAKFVKKAEPVATPTFDPAAGAYTSGQSVTIGCATEGATVRYCRTANC